MREIKLSAGLSRYDTNAAFPIGDLELCVSNLPTCSGEFRLVAYMNSKKIDTYTLTRDNANVTIPRDKLSAGVFSCRVVHIQGDTVVQNYRIENLVITELNDDLSAEPEITALNARITELTEKTTGFETALTEATETIQTLKTELEIAKNTIASIKETATATATEYNKAIEVINNLSERVYAIEKNYDPTIIE